MEENKSGLTREKYKIIKNFNRSQMESFLTNEIQAAYSKGWDEGQDILTREFINIVYSRHDWWWDFIEHVGKLDIGELNFTSEQITFLLQEARVFVNKGDGNMNQTLVCNTPLRWRKHDDKTYVAVVDVTNSLLLSTKEGKEFVSKYEDKHFIKEPYGKNGILMVDTSAIRPLVLGDYPTDDKKVKEERKEFIRWFNETNFEIGPENINIKKGEEGTLVKQESKAEEVKTIKEGGPRMRLSAEEGELINLLRAGKKYHELEKEVKKLQEEIERKKEESANVLALSNDIIKLQEENKKLTLQVDDLEESHQIIEEQEKKLAEYEAKFDTLKSLFS